MSRLYAETNAEGKRHQRFLHKPLEQFFCEELLEMPEESSFDFQGLTFWLEVKARATQYRSDDKYAEQGWWIGMPKVKKCRESKIPVFFIYYFPSDSTVWLLEYQEELFSQFVPFYNQQGQGTIAIPKRFWTRIDLGLSTTA
jgi:hypothetical protein